MFEFFWHKSALKNKPLGARLPESKPYADKYPLTVETIPSTETPVVIGIPWYTNFDEPQLDLGTRRWWVGRKANLGYVRGGHCVCLKPYNLTDYSKWWRFYDQGNEGACVGFGLSRAMSLMNVASYDGFWLYYEAQAVDEWEDTPPQEGTSVDAGCQILSTLGHKRVILKNGVNITQYPDSAYGIKAYRWAKSIDDIHLSLKNPVADKLGALPFLNSWGLAYPHVTWMPDEVADRVIFSEYGEAAVLTDK